MEELRIHLRGGTQNVAKEDALILTQYSTKLRYMCSSNNGAKAGSPHNGVTYKHEYQLYLVGC